MAPSYVHHIAKSPGHRLTYKAQQKSHDQLRDLESTKLVGGPVHNGAIIGTKDLVGQTAPFRVVDAVNPVFSLDNDTPVLVNVRGTRVTILGLVALGLRFLGRDAAVLTTTGIDLERSLVSGDVQTDTRLLGSQACSRDQRVLGSVRWAVDQKAGVVAGAATATETGGLLDILADQLGLGEVQGAVIGCRYI